MEAILGIVLLVLMVTAGFCLFFLAVVQMIWAMVDVAISKKQSNGVKIIVILLTLLCLGPIMTIVYGCFLTDSGLLRKATLISLIVLVLSGAGVVGLAVAVPALRKQLPPLEKTGAIQGPGQCRTVESWK